MKRECCPAQMPAWGLERARAGIRREVRAGSVRALLGLRGMLVVVGPRMVSAALELARRAAILAGAQGQAAKTLRERKFARRVAALAREQESAVRSLQREPTEPRRK